MRNAAGEEVLQALDPGGEVFDVFIQPVGLETIEDAGTEGVEVDGLPLQVPFKVQIQVHVHVQVEIEIDAPLRNTDVRGNAWKRLDLVFGIWQSNFDRAVIWVVGVVNEGGSVSESNEGKEEDGGFGEHDEIGLDKVIKMTGRKKAPGLRMKDW